MPKLGLETDVVDEDVYRHTLDRFKEAGILLPTFSELAEPERISPKIVELLEKVDPDDAHPLNLFRVHWYNGAERRDQVQIPQHVVLPSSLTGIEARIVVLFGERFPMIRAHKVLAAYGCLAPRLITGQFDPTKHRAIWPSTGNYCRGGVAISRIMGCHGVAILPEGMSRERFQWLEDWVMGPEDVIATPGSESNVKEIYDKCNELDREPNNIIFNQFAEFGNHLVHYLCTGKAIQRVLEKMMDGQAQLRPRAFVASSGSAGTLGAGDYLKEQYGMRTVVSEALECPTILYNGFGEHNIQGIGDKHIPFIHNVMNTDVAVAISDRTTDGLNLLFNSDAGRAYLRDRRGVPSEIVEQFSLFGLSSLCNIVSAIKVARFYEMGPDDVVVTVATDSADMYRTEREKVLARDFNGRFEEVTAAEVFGEHLLGAGVDHLMEMGTVERERVFNLGYYTWVEQQGVSLEDFQARRSQTFWRGLRDLIPAWDEGVDGLNRATGCLDRL